MRRAPPVDLDDLEVCLTIDPDALDVAWLNQAPLMARWALKLEGAKRRLEIAKSRLRLREAQLDGRIRSRPKAFGIERISEGAINAVKELDEEVQERQKEVRAAQHVVSHYQAAVDSIHQQRYALQGLVQLLTMEYFAGPKMPRNLREEVKKSARNKLLEAKSRRGEEE